MRVSNLAQVLRSHGLTVVEHNGWQTRGREFPSQPKGAIRHWTAGARTGVLPSLDILVNGRGDLAGPLCNVAQERSRDGNDRVHVIAAGKANHAGSGEWNGLSGNYKFLGLEIEWSGPTEGFSARRKHVSELIMASLIECAGGSADNAAEHREYAPQRKIDTNLDGDELRHRIREILTAPPVPKDGKNMVVFYSAKGKAVRAAIDGVMIGFKSPDQIKALRDSLTRANVPFANVVWPGENGPKQWDEVMGSYGL